MIGHKKSGARCAPQTVDKKLFSPRRGRIALSANERIAEFLDFAIQAKFAYVNKLTRDARTAFDKEGKSVEKRRINRFCEAAALAAFVLLTAALALCALTMTAQNEASDNITPYGRWTYVVHLTGTTQDALITHEKYEELEKMFS